MVETRCKNDKITEAAMGHLRKAPTFEEGTRNAAQGEKQRVKRKEQMCSSGNTQCKLKCSSANRDGVKEGKEKLFPTLPKPYRMLPLCIPEQFVLL